MIDFAGFVQHFESNSKIYLNDLLIYTLYTFSCIVGFGIAFFLFALGYNFWKTLRNENEESIKWNSKVIQGTFIMIFILFILKFIFDFFTIDSVLNSTENQIDKIPPYFIQLQHQAEEKGRYTPNFVFEYYSGKVVGKHIYKDCSFLNFTKEYSLPTPGNVNEILYTFLRCSNAYSLHLVPEITTSVDCLQAIMKPFTLAIFFVVEISIFLGICIGYLIFAGANKFLKKSKYGCCNCSCQPNSKEIAPLEIK